MVDIVAPFVSIVFVNLAGLIPPGPLTFGLVRYARERSWRAALQFMTGIFLSDLLVALLLGISGTTLLSNRWLDLVSGIGGGILLGWLGGITTCSAWWPQVRPHQPGRGFGRLGPLTHGFAISIFNPLYWAWWGSVGLIFFARALQGGLPGIVVFFLAISLPTYAWFSAVFWAALKGTELLPARHQQVAHVICGTALIAFGIRLLFLSVQ